VGRGGEGGRGVIIDRRLGYNAVAFGLEDEPSRWVIEARPFSFPYLTLIQRTLDGRTLERDGRNWIRDTILICLAVIGILWTTLDNDPRSSLSWSRGSGIPPTSSSSLRLVTIHPTMHFLQFYTVLYWHLYSSTVTQGSVLRINGRRHVGAVATISIYFRISSL
jgi:hypothetical protein